MRWALLSLAAVASAAPRPAILHPCLENQEELPHDRPGCSWEPIIHPQHGCAVNWQCRPHEPMTAPEGSSPGCPFVEAPSSSTCDWEPQLDADGICVTWWSCRQLREVEEDFTQYYLGPYYFLKHLYPEQPPGWKGGYGVRYWPAEHRHLIE